MLFPAHVCVGPFLIPSPPESHLSLELCKMWQWSIHTYKEFYMGLKPNLYQNSVSIFILCIFHFHQMKQGGFTDWAMRILRSPWLSADVVSASCYHHSIGYGSWEMSSCLGFVIKYLGKGVDLETSLSFSSFLCKIKSWGRCYIASNLSSTSSILLFFYIGLGSLKYASYWLMYWCPLLTGTPQTS